MIKSKIILTSVMFLVATRELPSQQMGPQPTPNAGAYIVPNGQPVAGQPYLQGPPMVQQGTPAVPIYPPQSTVVPLPSQTPGSIFAPPQVQPLPLPTGAAPPGVIIAPQPGLPGQPLPPACPPNTIVVPVVDEGLTWDQIVDVVHDYFPIAREQRARRSGEAWTEGRIDTVPQTGATVLEPHKRDSVGSFNRWESTFQSIRRRAILRVIPDPNGYLVEVTVEKELEDLPKPERGRVGPSSFGSELTLPTKRLEEITRTHSSPRWIQLGRDPALEQRMLADIHARLNGVTAQGSVFAP